MKSQALFLHCEWVSLLIEFEYLLALRVLDWAHSSLMLLLWVVTLLVVWAVLPSNFSEIPLDIVQRLPVFSSQFVLVDIALCIDVTF